MSKNNMVNAGTLRYKDIIEVPVEACIISSMVRVPGQLKNRNAHLIELTVIPLSGPWMNCEGKFIVESNDLVPLIKRRTKAERRVESWKKFFRSLYDKTFGPKVEEVPQIPFKMTGPMT